MIPLTYATRRLLADIDRRNLDWWATHRIDLLMRQYLASPTLPATPPAVPAPRHSVPSDAKRGAG